MTLPFEAIAEARLILTDDLIRDALKADKKARQEAKKNAARPRRAARRRRTGAKTSRKRRLS